MNRDEAEARFQELRNMRPRFGPDPRRWPVDIIAIRQWDSANGELALEYRAVIERLEALDREDANRRHEAGLLDRLRATGLMERTIQASFQPETTDALNRTRGWFEGKCSWLILYGAVGTGKTVAAACAIRQAIESGRSSKFKLASGIGSMGAFGDDAVEWERLKRVHLLVLDDVGTEKTSNWSDARFFDLLNARHESNLRTILTTNLDKQALAKWLGTRIVDRIAQSVLSVQFEGRSMRRA